MELSVILSEFKGVMRGGKELMWWVDNRWSPVLRFSVWYLPTE